MNLTEFITNLFQTGEVTIAAQVFPFAEDDLQATVLLLQKRHLADALDMPYQAPGFVPDAAAWGAVFLYRAVQLAMLRELDAEAVEVLLPGYPTGKTPEIIYSVDLCLRHLGDLLNLSRGLAPADPLVTRLKAVAFEWPFSSVGIPIDAAADLQAILGHASLKQAYIDRIIAARDQHRISNMVVSEAVESALGEYQGEFWTNFEPLEN